MILKLLLSLAAAVQSAAVTETPKIRVGSGISWSSCPEINQVISAELGPYFIKNFDCANITVPLDYMDPNSTLLTLNLFKLNATEQPAKGSVLVNFGGPGGTGAESLPSNGVAIAKYVGGQYDIVTWDPRGTGHTIPFVCNISAHAEFPPPSNNRKRDLELVKPDWLKLVLGDASQSGWNFAGQIADACYNDNKDVGRFISSVSTAKDAMSIVDALDEDGLIRYWGWSYGTALGSYIATLFPDRIDRMVLDGNLNPPDYQSGTYRNEGHDTNKAFQAFLQECLNNKDECALARYTNAQSTDDMLKRINAALAPLAENVTDVQSYFTYSSLAASPIFNALYFPVNWPSLAYNLTINLQEAECPASNGSSTAPVSSTAAAAASSTATPYNLGESWAGFGIRGANATFQPATEEDFLATVQYQANQTSFYDVYVGSPVSARWKITPKDRYYGDFNAVTKTPILYVNGLFDPITPIIDAYNASQGFEGSTVLAHNGYGHGVIKDDSDCVKNYTNAYFLHGTLPPAGIVCQSNQGPWPLAASSSLVPDVSHISPGSCGAPAVASFPNGTSSSLSTPTPPTPVVGGGAKLSYSASLTMLLLLIFVI